MTNYLWTELNFVATQNWERFVKIFASLKCFGSDLVVMWYSLFMTISNNNNNNNVFNINSKYSSFIYIAPHSQRQRRFLLTIYVALLPKGAWGSGGWVLNTTHYDCCQHRCMQERNQQQLNNNNYYNMCKIDISSNNNNKYYNINIIVTTKAIEIIILTTTMNVTRVVHFKLTCDTFAIFSSSWRFFLFL